jgi:segregation and condensation protein B
LETLAIISYRQPITRAQMEEIRGVSVDGVIGTLVDRELVEVVGRAEVPGRPQTYGTTQMFLEYFGLRGLKELPDAEELRQVPISKPKAPITTDEDDEKPEQMSLEEVTQTKDNDAAQPVKQVSEGEKDDDDDDFEDDGDDEEEFDDDEDEAVEEASQTK